MKFVDIIREQLLLMEDVAKAEKVLRQYGVPLDNPEYLELKQKAVKDNSIGFLGIVISLAFNNDRRIPDAKYLYDVILSNRQDLSFLPTNINDYTSYNNLLRDLRDIGYLKLKKKFSNFIVDKSLKAEFMAVSTSIDNDLVYFFSNIDGTADAKTFKQKLNRYKTVNDIIKYLSTYVDFHQRDFSYEKVLNKVKERGDLKLLYDNDGKVLVQVTTHEGLKAIGSPSWCIYNDSNQYENYTQGGQNNQFVFFNFDENIDTAYSMIGFTMNGSQITASHLMDDQHIEDVMSYLNKIGVYPKIKAINTELEKIKRNKEVVDEHIRIIGTLEDNDYLPDAEKRGEYRNSITYILKSIMGDPGKYGEEYDADNFITYSIFYVRDIGKVQENFRILFTKFFNDLFGNELDQNILITKLMNSVKFLQTFIWLNITGGYDEHGDDIIHLNFKKFNLLSNDRFFYSVNIETKQSITNLFKKLFINFKEMDKQTYTTILNTLRHWEVSEDEINNLIRFRKTKHGGDYSHVEFHNLKTKGNLSGAVLNKIQKARRGEDVDITYQEVVYGIEKGMQKTLINYYRSILPQFEEQQVDLDDARIYKALGLSQELKDIVLKKYNMMGGDQNPHSINSIERSILDVG